MIFKNQILKCFYFALMLGLVSICTSCKEEEEKDLGIVFTQEVTDITKNSGVSGGNVTSDGGADIVARGIVWSKSPAPSLDDDSNSEGEGLGLFTSNITGLEEGATYFVRAYATNSVGTTYGLDVSFTTETPWACGDPLTVAHVAGDVAPVTKTVSYNTVMTDLSGENKCWITQNLGASEQASSATSVNDATQGWYWQFNRKQGYQHNSGGARIPSSWDSPAGEDSDWLPENDPCAILLGSGWRLPTYSEYYMVNDVNGLWSSRDEAYASILKYSCDGRVSRTGNLERFGTHGYWWTSTQRDSYSSDGHRHTIASSASDMGTQGKDYGFSVRCLQDQ